MQARVVIQALRFSFCLGGNDEQRRAYRREAYYAEKTASRPVEKKSTYYIRTSSPADLPILEVHSLAAFHEKRRDTGGELGRVGRKDPLWSGWRDLKGLEAYCRTRRLSPRLIAAL